MTHVFKSNDSLGMPKGFHHQVFEVGPFKVQVSNKGHYRLYTSDIADAIFLKQASFPSVDQLYDDLRLAVKLRKVPSRSADPYLKACLPLLNKGYSKTKRIDPPWELAKKGGVK